MCAFDKDSPDGMRRRRAAVIASCVPAFTSSVLLARPHLGESHHFGPLFLGVGVGVTFGVAILGLRRLVG